MNQEIRMNEEELKNLINECVNEVLNEDNNESFFKNLGKGLKAGMNANVDNQRNPNKGLVSQTLDGIKQRVQTGKQGFNLQKEYTNFDKLKQELKRLVDNGVISPRQTVNQLINWNVGSKQNKDLGQGAKGFGGAKSDYQRKAKEMGIKLDEAIDQAIKNLTKK